MIWTDTINQWLIGVKRSHAEVFLDVCSCGEIFLDESFCLFQANRVLGEFLLNSMSRYFCLVWSSQLMYRNAKVATKV